MDDGAGQSDDSNRDIFIAQVRFQKKPLGARRQSSPQIGPKPKPLRSSLKKCDSQPQSHSGGESDNDQIDQPEETSSKDSPSTPKH